MRICLFHFDSKILWYISLPMRKHSVENNLQEAFVDMQLFSSRKPIPELQVLHIYEYEAVLISVSLCLPWLSLLFLHPLLLG